MWSWTKIAVALIVPGGLALALISDKDDIIPGLQQVLDLGNYLTGATLDITAFTDSLNVANAWIPIDEFFAMMILFLAFIPAYLLVKFIIKLIPTIG